MKINFSNHRSFKKPTTSTFACFSMVIGLFAPQIAMAQSETTAFLDYDSDSREEIAFRRASSFETIIKRSSDGQTQRVTFGRSEGDVPVVGDFDGDNITDVAVRRASNQTWYINNSSGVDRITGNSDGITRKRFGLQVGDIPVVADYDGDGISDIAVRRPSNHTWYILNSSGTDLITGYADGITRRQFGLREEDIPVPMDYDGDGKADLAVRRPSTQTWFILNSSGVDSISNYSDGITRRQFGTQEADIPVPADYDGDGKADLAVRRPSAQFWYILNSSGIDHITGNSDGISRRRFGTQETDIPTPADYDGDGKVDLAVRRATTGQWFVLNSSGNDILTNNSDGITRLTFGNQPTDLPLAQPMFSIWTYSDIDEDGLSKIQEDNIGTDFTLADTDSDGLNDGDELRVHNTNPLIADTDGDGLTDGDEINTHNTDPNSEDSDGDGVSDGTEIASGTDPNGAAQALEFSQGNLIASIVDNVYLPTFELFAQRSQSLNTAVADYCAALPNDTDDNRAAAQVQWKESMASWQMAEMMQVGPLFFNSNELRNQIYSWPNRRACFVDQNVVAAEEAGFDITSQNVSGKGLDALEYLLFDDDLDHKCTFASDALANWNNRSDEDRIAARCDFAKIVASDVLTNANAIVTAWTGDSGYADVIKNAGNSDSEFATSLEAINDISDGLFYFTGLLKDGKIATPVGLRANNCGLTACPEDAESFYADYSLENIITNMKALRVLLLGGTETDIGFIDFLNEEGDTTTATNIIVALDEAISLAEGFTGTYTEVLTQNPDSIIQLHSEVNDVDDILKGDFIQSLALELPATSAGDND